MPTPLLSPSRLTSPSGTTESPATALPLQGLGNRLPGMMNPRAGRLESIWVLGHPLLSRGCVSMLRSFPELAEVPVLASDVLPPLGELEPLGMRMLVLVAPADWNAALQTLREWQVQPSQLAILAAFTPETPGTTLSRLLRLGTSGFLLADADEGEWQTAIHELRERRAYQSDAASRFLTEASRSTVIRVLDHLAPDHLRGRKREVLELALQGRSQREIAEQLGLCPRSIRDYLRRLRRAPAVQSALLRAETSI